MLNQLDDADIQILRLLQDNARLSNTEIGERVAKSQGSVNMRLKRLHEEGFILKHVAILDPVKLERGMMVLTHLQLRDHSRKALKQFESEINKIPEVLECLHVSGMFDFTLRVVVKDVAAYQDFLENTIFEAVPMANVQSSFVLKQSKSGTALPLNSAKQKEKKGK